MRKERKHYTAQEKVAILGRRVCCADESPATMIIERTTSAHEFGAKKRRCIH